LCVTWVAEVAAAYPYPLTFFNVLAGGPSNGYRVLADSNLGWGQGLKDLKRWMSDHGVEHVNLAYFGQADPAYYQINHTPLPSSGFQDRTDFGAPKLPGYVAISGTTLTGVHLTPWLRLLFAPFRARQPTAIVGNSIRLYWVNRWPIAAAASSRDAPDAPRRLADALLYGAHWPAGAVPYYERHLGSRPSDAEALRHYGLALLQADRMGDGIVALRRSIAADGRSSAARLMLARALFAVQDLGGAMEQALATLSLYPTHAEAHHVVARIRLAEGNPDAAAASLHRALESDPAHAASRELLAALPDASKPSGIRPQPPDRPSRHISSPRR
ncbi:MAG TPA: tetratricopeptide repeat protein, partial [Vicinamibacterales bacterium]